MTVRQHMLFSSAPFPSSYFNLGGSGFVDDLPVSKPAAAGAAAAPAKKKAVASLFDDGDDSDLFGAKTPAKKPAAKPSSSLFD
jgi:hypothetical protein